jgi:hypothetical protein
MIGFIPLDPLMDFEEVAENINCLEMNEINGQPLYFFAPNLATPLSVYDKTPYSELLKSEDGRRLASGNYSLITGFDRNTGVYTYRFKDPRLDLFLSYYRDRWYEPFQCKWRKIKQGRQANNDTRLNRAYSEYNKLNFLFFKRLYQLICEESGPSKFELLLMEFIELREALVSNIVI